MFVVVQLLVSINRTSTIVYCHNIGLIAMSSKKHSAMEQWFQKNCSWAIPRSRRVSSTSQHSDAPDAQARPTTIPTNVPSTSTVSRHLPLSPAQGTSHEAFVKPSIIVNQPVTAPELPGSSIGKQIQLPRVYR